MTDKKSPKFEFKGAGFEVGAGAAGEKEGALQKDFTKMKVKNSNQEDVDDDKGDDEDEDEEDELGVDIPKAVLKRVAAVRKLQSNFEDLDVEYKKERIQLELKYMDLKKPLYATRQQIITGEIEPPTDGDEAGEVEATEEDSNIKGIPGFWLQCLTNHPSIGDIITEEDINALKFLTNITCDYDETFTSFTLHFHFDENPFFSNTVLNKKYVVSPDLLDDKAPALTDNKGDEIQWKPSMNLCVQEITKKQRAKSGKNKGQVRTVKETVDKPSFFHYFSSPKTEEEEDEEDDDKEPIKLSMEEDYDIGHAIRTSVIPEGVLWFTGEAIEDEDFDEEDDEDEDDDEDDEDEEESEEEEPVQKPKKGKGGNKKQGGFAGGNSNPSGAGAGGEQPECKQN